MKKINLNNYQSLFQGKADRYFILTDLFLEYFKKFETIAFSLNGHWTNYMPKEQVKVTLNKGVEIYGNKKNFLQYKKGFKVFRKSFEKESLKFLEKDVLSKSDLEYFFQGVAEFFSFYSKTEFFSTEKVFQEKKMIISDKQFGEIKDKGREFLNLLLINENCFLDQFLKKISDRFKVNSKDLLLSRADEILGLFEGGELNTKEIKLRKAGYIFYYDRKVLTVDSGKSFYKFLLNKEDNKKSNFLKGVVASKGLYKGRVFVVPFDIEYVFNNLDKLNREMEKGDVLVAETTSPELMSLIKKAKAIITNQGGQLSHAAIVSREMKIPCIVGTKNATQVLKTGNLVEVDANKGEVRILEKE